MRNGFLKEESYCVKRAQQAGSLTERKKQLNNTDNKQLTNGKANTCSLKSVGHLFYVFNNQRWQHICKHWTFVLRTNDQICAGAMNLLTRSSLGLLMPVSFRIRCCFASSKFLRDINTIVTQCLTASAQCCNCSFLTDLPLDILSAQPRTGSSTKRDTQSVPFRFNRFTPRPNIQIYCSRLKSLCSYPFAARVVNVFPFLSHISPTLGPHIYAFICRPRSRLLFAE